MRQLKDMLDFLQEDVLTDAQKRYFVVVDGLDENWVEDELRYRLIRALIETVRSFQAVRNAKVVIALRRDLIDRVFERTRDAGFQEEKYHGLYLDIAWTREQLAQVVDRRVNALVRRQYTKGTVALSDVFVEWVHSDGRSAIDYMLDRTMLRPRDIISFFNLCIQKALDHPKITQTMLYEAEAEYSRSRLRALADEWDADYPELTDFAMILKGGPAQFQVRNLPVAEFCLRFITSGRWPEGPLTDAARRLVETDELSEAWVRSFAASVFYRAGLIGLRTDRYAKAVWSFAGGPNLSPSDVGDDAVASVHPAFFVCLSVRKEGGWSV